MVSSVISGCVEFSILIVSIVGHLVVTDIVSVWTLISVVLSEI